MDAVWTFEIMWGFLIRCHWFWTTLWSQSEEGWWWTAGTWCACRGKRDDCTVSWICMVRRWTNKPSLWSNSRHAKQERCDGWPPLFYLLIYLFILQYISLLIVRNIPSFGCLAIHLALICLPPRPVWNGKNCSEGTSEVFLFYRLLCYVKVNPLAQQVFTSSWADTNPPLN